MADLEVSDAVVGIISVFAGFGGKSLIDYLKESKRADAVSSLRDRVTRLESDAINFRLSTADKFATISENLKEIGVDVKALLGNRRDHD